jgi:hypothetical protein
MATKKFAAVVDGDVFTVMTIDSEYSTTLHPGLGERLIAGFSSDPKIIEIPEDQEIDIGWTWDGEIFIKSIED